jgi:exonuclease III
MHLNTQIMMSTFDEFILTINQFPFDIITLSETWLKDNPYLLDYVSIPGYVNIFRNRNHIRGGGVGIYCRDHNINFKQRQDIEKLQPDMERIWLEIPGRNKNSKLLLGVMYRSEIILSKQSWLDGFESILSYLLTRWDGLLLITGDMNVDLLNSSSPLTKQYLEILDMHSFQQMVTKPTRITATSQTLIDYEYRARC